MGTIPAARASGATSATTAIASSVLIPWFACENSSLTPTTQLTSSTPVAAARWKPRVLSTSPIQDAGPATAARTPATTASASAICGHEPRVDERGDLGPPQAGGRGTREISSTFCSVVSRAGIVLQAVASADLDAA